MDLIDDHFSNYSRYFILIFMNFSIRLRIMNWIRGLDLIVNQIEEVIDVRDQIANPTYLND